LIKAGLTDWKAIKRFSNEALRIFRGKDPIEVKKMLLKSKKPNVDLANIFGLSTMHSSPMYKISQFFSGQDMYAKDLQKYLRKEEAKKLLGEGEDPQIILEEYFDLQIWKTKSTKIYLDKSKIRYYFEDLFPGLTFEQIIREYSNNPGNMLDRYTKGNVILKE